MKKSLALFLVAAILSVGASARQQPAPQQTQQTPEEEEVVRISSELVQMSVVVTDKNDRVVTDLKKDDFEVYENGRRQDVKFMEFVGVDSGERRTEGASSGPTLPESARIERELSAKDLRRVIAFVVDDLTIPYGDMVTVRKTLRDFIDNKMQPGDLVAIVRTVGGKGMLEQLTSDKQLLRRAVSRLNVTITPYSTDSGLDNEAYKAARDVAAEGGSGIGPLAENLSDIGVETLTSAYDESVRVNRALIALSTADGLIKSLGEIPGRKSLVLLSGGLPGFGAARSTSANIGGGARMKVPDLSTGLGAYLNRVLRLLSDHAVRAGVVINTIDPRGLNASPGVVGFQATPAGSALIGGDPNFGKGGSETDVFGDLLAGADEHLSLRVLSDATGGVAVTNTNDIAGGLDKVLARGRGYYVLAYTPSEKFDNKFRKLDVKVKRAGLRLYKYAGYLASEPKPAGPRTKEQEIAAAARAPLARRDVDVNANLSMRLTPKGADLGINLLIDPKTLTFTEAGDRQHDSFDVVGFIVDETGKTRGGFSQTVNLNLTPDKYREAVAAGLDYSANTQLPPGYYQMRVVVREEGTGSLGTVSRYIEVPDLSKGRPAMSSIFLHAVDTANPSKPPVPLTALRQLSRKDDLRYTAIVYNPKLEGGKPQLREQTIISRGDRVIYRGPERAVAPRGGDAAQVFMVEQVGLPKAAPGHYVLTLVVTDALADKKSPPLARSIDFQIVD
jgi:VWFA-related protein